MYSCRIGLVYACLCLVVGCLPGERGNTVPDDVGNQDIQAVLDDASSVASDSLEQQNQTDSTLATTTDSIAMPVGCTRDVDCDALALGDCSSAICDLATGLCQLQPDAEGQPCSTVDPCVVNASCQSGQCKGDLRQCDDDNACTDDGCLAFQGCVHKPVVKPCDDEDPCTLSDACTATSCVGIAKQCADALPCRVASCNPKTGQCVNDQFAAADAACDDANPCTKSDKCDAQGTCSGTKVESIDCDDSNPCTVDQCNTMAGGCIHVMVAGVGTCDDGDVCTVDACKDGKCISVAKDCDDDNPCTTDSCALVAGQGTCTHDALSDVACTASQPCADEAVCLAGSCTITKAKVCDDNNPCTQDSCDPSAAGCVATPIVAQCNDGDGCTLNDVCSAGKCVGTNSKCDDGNPCTVDLCDPLTAKCSYSNQQDGSVCGQSKICKAGVCEASP